MTKIPLKYLPIMGIALLIAVIGVFLIKAGHEGVDDSALTDLAPEEGLRLKNIHYIQDNPDEGAKWVLDANEVTFSKDKQHISFNSFHLKLGPENDLSIELTGNRGDYDKISNEINLKGDLEGYTGNGYKILTNHLLYKQKEGYLETDEPVKITGPFFTVTGSGLHVNIERETLRIISDVTTLVERESLLL